MSFFDRLLTGPLYTIVHEVDDQYDPINDTQEIVQVWGVFEDGSLVVKDDKADPPCLIFSRAYTGDPTLFFSLEDAQKAFDRSEVAQ